jgi:hypothetical protein
VLDGIIAHLTRECGGNVHDRGVVDVRSLRLYKNQREWAGKKVVDLAEDSAFWSAHRDESQNLPHSRNNWICHDFKNRRIVPTYYIISSFGGMHLKSWLVETSVDDEAWQHLDHKDNTTELNGCPITRTFATAVRGDRPVSYGL